MTGNDKMLESMSSPVARANERPAQRKEGESSTVRREIDRIARQLDGLTKSLKRVKDSL